MVSGIFSQIRNKGAGDFNPASPLVQEVKFSYIHGDISAKYVYCFHLYTPQHVSFASHMPQFFPAFSYLQQIEELDIGNRREIYR